MLAKLRNRLSRLRHDAALLTPEFEPAFDGASLSAEQIQALKALIASRPYWYHAWSITKDVSLPGSVNVHQRLKIWNVPNQLAGCKVLDLGANDGAFSLELARRGAEVVAVDTCPPDFYGLESLSKILQSTIKYVQLSVYDIDSVFEKDAFDYTLFSGLFYHLRHPLLALDKIRAVTKRGVWVESYVIDNGFVRNGKRMKLPAYLRGVPVLQFYRTDELSSDPTNWFGPTVKCLEEILWSCGFIAEFKGFDPTGYRGHFWAEKLDGMPEHERIIMESRSDIKHYGVKHYKS